MSLQQDNENRMMRKSIDLALTDDRLVKSIVSCEALQGRVSGYGGELKGCKVRIDGSDECLRAMSIWLMGNMGVEEHPEDWTGRQRASVEVFSYFLLVCRGVMSDRRGALVIARSRCV